MDVAPVHQPGNGGNNCLDALPKSTLPESQSRPIKLGLAHESLEILCHDFAQNVLRILPAHTKTPNRSLCD